MGNKLGVLYIFTIACGPFFESILWVPGLLRVNEGCVQFGPYMYRQTSGVFMGTSPAPEQANDFAFWHEYELFLTHMVNEYKQYGPGRYPFEFISQYAGSTKQYIDDITVSRGHTIGPSLQDIILQNGVFYGMYPTTTVREFDGIAYGLSLS